MSKVTSNIHVIAAFDSFKGCMSSRRAGEAAAAGVRDVWPDARVTIVEMSDGGEGMAEAIFADGIGEKRSVSTFGPLMQPIVAEYVLDGTTAYIDMASAAGLNVIKSGEKNPMKSTTFGVGVIILDAIEHGAECINLGLGGSATVDGGCGALMTFGVKFLDEYGKKISGLMTGADLRRIRAIDLSEVPQGVRRCRFRLLCDVDNPLCGPRGAAAVFAPQKGATPVMVEALELGLSTLGESIKKLGFTDVFQIAGGGAAGGMGASFATLLGGEIMSGGEEMIRIIGLEQKMRGCCLVLTGEGRSDAQTASGKLPACVANAARRAGVPVWLLSGELCKVFDLKTLGFNEIFCINGKVDDPAADPLDPAVATRRLRQTLAAALNEGEILD